MKARTQFIFTSSDTSEPVTITTISALVTYAMPEVDEESPAVTLANNGGVPVCVSFPGDARMLAVQPGEIVLCQPGDAFGDLMATAAEINLAGAGEVVITRGQTSQQVVAMD